MVAADVQSVRTVLALDSRQHQVAWLDSHGLSAAGGLAALLDQAEQLVHSDPESAENLARLCDAVAGERALSDCVARSRYVLARLRAERGELESALTLVGEARAAWLHSGNALQAARTDLGRMQILDDLGRHDAAARIGEALVADLAQLPVDPEQAGLSGWLRAAALENIGVARSFTGDYGHALEAYRRAEAEYRSMGRLAETARPQANRGIELLALGRAREALDVLNAAARTFADSGDRLWAAKCLGNVAQAHQQLGELIAALHVLERARVAVGELGAGPELARLQLATATTYLDLGLYREADTEATAAAERTAASGMRHDLALAQLLVALARARSGQFVDATAHLREAQHLFAEVGDRQYQARAALVEAEVAALSGRRAEAARLAGDAAEQLRLGGWPVPLAWALLLQADFVDDADAAALLERAGDLIDTLQLPLLQHERDLRTARWYRRRGSAAVAVPILGRAVDRIEELGSSLPDHQLRAAFRSDRLGAHDELVDLLVHAGAEDELARACEVSDLAKARTLTDLVDGALGVGGTARRRGSPLSAQLANTRADLAAVYSSLHECASPERRTALRLEADALERSVSALRLRIASATPDDGRRQHGGSVRSRENDDEAVLAFHVCGRDVIAFVLHGGRVQARRIEDVRATVDELLDSLGTEWARFRLGPRFVERHHDALVETAQAVCRSLHEALIAPVADLLETLPGHRLTIVPHRTLGNVPFAALGGATDGLLARWTLTVAPMAARSAPTGMPDVLDAVVLAVADAAAPGVRDEAAAIQRAIPAARVLVDAEATVGAVRALRAPGLLHLACHGIYHAGNPLFSRLRLADGWLTAAEVLELDLRGTVVILSACESGRQGQTAEPVGLAWAFLAAGARGVVVSRWVVPDTATAHLMAALYRQLAVGTDPAAALRAAQLATARSWPHPFHWASFSYISAETVADGSTA